MTGGFSKVRKWNEFGATAGPGSGSLVVFSAKSDRTVKGLRFAESYMRLRIMTEIACDGLGTWLKRAEAMVTVGAEFDLAGFEPNFGLKAGAAPRPTMLEWCDTLAKEHGMHFSFNPDMHLGFFRK